MTESMYLELSDSLQAMGNIKTKLSLRGGEKTVQGSTFYVQR